MKTIRYNNNGGYTTWSGVCLVITIQGFRLHALVTPHFAYFGIPGDWIDVMSLTFRYERKLNNWLMKFSFFQTSFNPARCEAIQEESLVAPPGQQEPHLSHIIPRVLEFKSRKDILFKKPSSHLTRLNSLHFLIHFHPYSCGSRCSWCSWCNCDNCNNF